MSVPQSKRKLSSLEFFHVAYDLRKNLTMVLLRNFGLKDRIRRFSFVAKAYNMEEKDVETVSTILEKYDLEDSIIESYPKWLLNHFRSNILKSLTNLIRYLTLGNSIFPSCKEKFKERRKWQDKALSECHFLFHELDYLVQILPINANKLAPYCDKLENEISLIKRWKKSDGKYKQKFQE